MSFSPNIRTVGGNDESGRITCHRLEFTILCRSLLYYPNSPYPVRLFGTKSSRCPPLLSSSKTRCRPSTIKTRASGSPSERLETCETADHFHRAQNLSVCTLPSQKPCFHDCLPRSQESIPSPLVLEASSSTSPISPTDLTDDANSVDFVARVSTIPLVNTALRAYEQTKASSRMVKVRFFSSFSTSP